MWWSYSKYAYLMRKLLDPGLNVAEFPPRGKLVELLQYLRVQITPIHPVIQPNICTSVASKLIECHVRGIVESFIIKSNSPISNQQWGFMSKCSTVSALIRVVDEIKVLRFVLYYFWYLQSIQYGISWTML